MLIENKKMTIDFHYLFTHSYKFIYLEYEHIRHIL